MDRLCEGKAPICVLSCSLRALDFDSLENLQRHYGEGDALEGLPEVGRVRPSAVFKRSAAKRQLIPWDAEEALALWRGRGPLADPSLPPLFDRSEEVVEVPEGIVGRDRLVLKARTVADLAYRTQDDE